MSGDSVDLRWHGKALVCALRLLLGRCHERCRTIACQSCRCSQQSGNTADSHGPGALHAFADEFDRMADDALADARIARILVVEDDDGTRNALTKMLVASSYDVTEAHEYRDALPVLEGDGHIEPNSTAFASSRTSSGSACAAWRAVLRGLPYLSDGGRTGVTGKFLRASLPETGPFLV